MTLEDLLRAGKDVPTDAGGVRGVGDEGKDAGVPAEYVLVAGVPWDGALE